MNAIEQARQAYAPTAYPLKSNRAVESQLIGQVTARLKKAAMTARTNFPGLVAALDQNRAMWTTFAADVADPDNTLPQYLRAQLFYLAEFTEHQSKQVLRGTGSADILVEINTAVMRGLNGAGAKT